MPGTTLIIIMIIMLLSKCDSGCLGSADEATVRFLSSTQEGSVEWETCWLGVALPGAPERKNGWVSLSGKN